MLITIAEGKKNKPVKKKYFPIFISLNFEFNLLCLTNFDNTKN